MVAHSGRHDVPHRSVPEEAAIQEVPGKEGGCGQWVWVWPIVLWYWKNGALHEAI